MKKKSWISIFFLACVGLSLIFFYTSSTQPFPQIKKISGNGCIVLNYHRIRPGNSFIKFLAKLSGNPELNTYSVFKNDFIKQISFLEKKKFQFITPKDLDDYLNDQKQMPHKCALITFDDVDRSVYNYAYPILKQKNIPFTIFIITGAIGQSNFNGLTMINWSQIKEMNRSNLVTIGTHTHQLHYIENDEKPPFLKSNNIATFVEDSKKSREAFYSHLGYEPKYFAYPYGYGLPQTDKILLSQKYDLLFTLAPGIVNKDTPAFFVNRVLVDDISWKAIKNWVNNI
ncbi:polysaccharide deacetylase family protein [Bacillus cereus]